MPRRNRLPLFLLILSALLFRSLIPTGFMPATGPSARHGAMLMLCPHGAMGMESATHGHDTGNGKNPAHPTLEQCPFGAAMGPAVHGAGAPLALSFPTVAARFQPDWTSVPGHHNPPHLQPPARGPPAFS